MSKLLLCAVAILAISCGEVVNAPPDTVNDPCVTGTCECTAATEDTDCGAHQFCNATDAGRTCDCVAGYTSGVNGCVWTGTMRDTGLSMSGVWQPANGALMNPTALGGVDPGEASFLPSALCSLAHVKQAVDMPTFAKAEPLVLELTYKNQVDFMMGFDQVLMGVSFGGGWSPFPNFNDALFHSVRICLPEGAYAPRGTAGAGAPVTFALGPYQQPDRCPSSTVTNFAVDHAEIVAANAGECGAVPGEAVNFDAEGIGGWTFTTSGNSSGGFASGLGAAGTRAARVTLNQRCDGASMSTTFNVPAITNPSLEMFVGATAGTNGTISFGGLFSMGVLDVIPNATQNRTLKMCLPPSMRGQIMTMSFFLNGGSGSCADVLNHQVFADNIRVVDDPTCDSRDNFVNPGFEQGSAPPWGSFGRLSSSTAVAAVRNAVGQSHNGTRYLALESNGRCSSSGYTMLPVVPAPSGTAGPALKFFAKVGTNPDASTFVSARGSATQTLTEGGAYLPYTFCLNPLYVGRPQPVFLSHSGGSGLCDNSNYIQQNAFIDDLTVTTDSLCPAQ